MLASLSAEHILLVPAAIVVYEPDVKLLTALLNVLDRGGRRIFLFLNGAVIPELDRSIAALANCNVIRSSANVGLSAGLNALVGSAHSEGLRNIILFDQDSTPDFDMPERLAAYLARLEQAGLRPAAVGPKLVTPEDGGFLPNRYSWRNKRALSVDFLPTSGSLIPLDVWSDVGLFREDYFVGGIDVEWGFRAWRGGYGSFVADKISMIHRWGTPSGDGDDNSPQILRQSSIRNFFYIRNAIDCLKLSYIPKVWRLKFATILVLQIFLLCWHRRRSAGEWSTVRRAIADGFRGALGPLPADLSPG